MKNKTLVIIPTCNEIENIEIIVREVYAFLPEAHILVVDDHSGDGTSHKIQDLQGEFPGLFMIERERKLGLGTAYLTGFKYALKQDYELIFEMDADRSHDPGELPRFLKAIENNDLVIGSRYVKGGRIENWPWHRHFLSWFGSRYARMITGMPLRDATGGYKCFRRQVLESLDLNAIKSEGYSFQIEMNYLTWKKGFRIKEIPIIFTDRTRGKSKMSRRIIFEALWRVWRMRFKG